MGFNVEMSLDDIIKKNKINKKRNLTGAKGRSGGKPKPGAATGKPKPAANKRQAKQAGGSPNKRNNKPGGGVQRWRNQGAIVKKSNMGRINNRQSNFSAGRNGSSVGRLKSVVVIPPSQASQDSGKVIVSNLDFGVTHYPADKKNPKNAKVTTGNEKKKRITAEELDADLDAYMMSVAQNPMSP